MYWPLPNSQEMLYFLPALYLRRVSVDEVFQELSGFLCSALRPRMRCRPAQSAKLYNLSKDLAGRNPQSSCNFDSFYASIVITSTFVVCLVLQSLCMQMCWHENITSFPMMLPQVFFSPLQIMYTILLAVYADSAKWVCSMCDTGRLLFLVLKCDLLEL